MNHAVLRHTVFVDECGYNIWTTRSHGRARRGERAYRQVCGQRGRNVTVCLAISPINGVVFHSAYLGGMNAVRFSDFLVRARLNLAWTPMRQSYSYMTAREHTIIQGTQVPTQSWKSSQSIARFLTLWSKQ